MACAIFHMAAACIQSWCVMQALNKTLTGLYKSGIKYALESSKLTNQTLTLYNQTLVLPAVAAG